MQPLDTYELILNFTILVAMPIMIWANLRKNGIENPLYVYLWDEHPNFMRVSLVVLGLLVLFSAVALLGHFGVLPGDLVERANLVIGIPFLVAAVAEIFLAVRGVLKVLRDRRRSRASKT